MKAPDGKTPVKAAHLSLVEAMAYSPDGKWLVSGSFQEIAICDIVTGQLRQKIPGFAHLVVGVAFSLDSKLFAVVGGEPTVEGELNKLCSNVGTGRNVAGVHWRSDAVESFKLGEKIAIAILEDQRGAYNENRRGFFKPFTARATAAPADAPESGCRCRRKRPRPS